MLYGINDGFDELPFGDQLEKKFCRYCCDTNELPIVYEGHYNYSLEGKASCPKMRAKGCANCGAKGDQAHCVEDCPEPLKSSLPASSKPMIVQDLIIKETKVQSPKPKKRSSPPIPLRIRLLKKMLREDMLRRRQNSITYA